MKPTVCFHANSTLHIYTYTYAHTRTHVCVHSHTVAVMKYYCISKWGLLWRLLSHGMFIGQAWRPEFRSQSPTPKVGHRVMHLQPQNWGADREYLEFAGQSMNFRFSERISLKKKKKWRNDWGHLLSASGLHMWTCTHAPIYTMYIHNYTHWNKANWEVVKTCVSALMKAEALYFQINDFK